MIIPPVIELQPCVCKLQILHSCSTPSCERADGAFTIHTHIRIWVKDSFFFFFFFSLQRQDESARTQRGTNRLFRRGSKERGRPSLGVQPRRSVAHWHQSLSGSRFELPLLSIQPTATPSLLHSGCVLFISFSLVQLDFLCTVSPSRVWFWVVILDSISCREALHRALFLLLYEAVYVLAELSPHFPSPQPVQIAFRIHFGGTPITSLGLQLICLFCYYPTHRLDWLLLSVSQSWPNPSWAPSNHWKGTRNLEGLRLIHPFIDGTRQ